MTTPAHALLEAKIAAAPAGNSLSRTSDDGRVTVSLMKLPKKATPVVTVTHNGAALPPDECAITKAAARERFAAACPAPIAEFVREALANLVAPWTWCLVADTHTAKGDDDDTRLTRDVEVWPEAVDPRAVLDALLTQIRRHVALPAHGDIVMALWIAHAHYIERLRYTPYLHLTSPTKQCGKTLVLEMLELTTPRPWRISNPTGAIMFRTIERERPTLLLDEIDTITPGPKLDDLTNVCNDGWHMRGKVARCVGDNNDVKTFSVFCAKALAGIGTTLQDATRSRCIRLPMARATGDALAKLTVLRTDRAERWAGPLRSQLARLAEDTGAYLAETLQEDTGVSLPRGVDGRDAQAWEPLLAIADLAGDEWARVAREACVALVSDRKAEDDGDAKVRLLRDVRAFFIERPTLESATSASVIAWLTEDESRGWAEYRGKEISAEALARLLKPFGIATRKTNDTDDVDGKRKTRRVWTRADLAPLWEKYLEPLRVDTPDSPDSPDSPAQVEAGEAGEAGVVSRTSSSADDWTFAPTAAPVVDHGPPTGARVIPIRGPEIIDDPNYYASLDSDAA